jgi:hypothetical protein
MSARRPGWIPAFAHCCPGKCQRTRDPFGLRYRSLVWRWRTAAGMPTHPVRTELVEGPLRNLRASPAQAMAPGLRQAQSERAVVASERTSFHCQTRLRYLSPNGLLLAHHKRKSSCLPFASGIRAARQPYAERAHIFPGTAVREGGDPRIPLVAFVGPRLRGDDSHALLQLLERHQLPRDRARGDRRWAREPHLPRPRSPRKVSVDRADRHLRRRRR